MKKLRKELKSGNTFDGWKEGQINFPPTYKFEVNSDTYVGEVPKESEKRRTPAWYTLFLCINVTSTAWYGTGIIPNWF